MSGSIISHIMPYYRNRFTTAPRCPAMPGEIRSDAMPSDAQRCQGNERCPAMPGEIRSDARDASDEQTQAMVTDDQLSEEQSDHTLAQRGLINKRRRIVMTAANIMDISHVSEMSIEQAIVCAARYLNKFHTEFGIHIPDRAGQARLGRMALS